MIQLWHILKRVPFSEAFRPSIWVICILGIILSVTPLTAQQAEDAGLNDSTETSSSASRPTQQLNKKVVPSPSASDATAQRRGPIVQEIVIEYVGPRSITREVILSNMRTTEGQPYSPSAVEEDVRNLYATGFFTNLRIYDEPLGSDSVKVVVVVQPKPIVKEIIVTGATRISEKAIRKKITTKVGDSLSEQKIAQDALAIRDYYQDKNFKNAQVEYKTDIEEETGRATVTYTILEDQKLVVREIVFDGAKAFKEKELKKVLKTKEYNLFSIINKSGRYKDEQIQEDSRLLRDYYYDHGYIDMSIKDIVYEPFDDNSLRIRFKIFEGIPYQVGKVTITNNSLFDTEKIRKRMKMLEGATYSPNGLQNDVKAVKDLYGEKGYAETEVSPQRQPNIESGKIDLEYKINEGDQYFVEKVVIQGNNRTKDKVLRRELALAPGDVYDTVRADASKKRLENLGYFSKVDVTNEPAAVPGRKHMVVTVEEQRTGSATFGAGFSTVDSLIGFVELSQGNFDIMNWPSFTGAGQKFRTRLQYGLKRKDFILSFTEPWFLNQKLAAGFDLFYNESNYLSSVYDQRRYGGAIRLSKALNEFWTISGRYQFENIEIFDVSSSASDIIREEEGSRIKSSIRGSVTYDTRDSVFLTRKGEKIEVFGEYAGGFLMGDTDIWSVGAEGQKFFSLPYDLIFSLNGATSVVGTHSGGDRIPIFDRLFIGGSRSVRGFDNRDVGPKDEEGEPIGGATMAYGNLELTYPIINRVRGAVFVDAGFNNEDTFDYDPSSVQVGVGFGFRLNLPIGPLRIDFGFPIIADRFNDQPIKFHFDAGYQF